MSDPSDFDDSAEAHDPELTEALRSGLRQAGYHVMRAGYELLAGVSAFLEAVGGAGADEGQPASERIEVE